MSVSCARSRHLIGGLAILAAAHLGATSARAQVSALDGTTQLLGSTTRGVDAAFDPVNGVYLVLGAYGPVSGVFVNINGQPVSAPFTISSGAGHSNFPRARYSPQLGAFMVTWSSEDTPTSLTVRTRGVAYPGALLGAEQVISDPGTRPWLEAAPAIAYSPTSQQFLVVWQGYPPSVTIKARLVNLSGTGVGPIVELSNGYGRDPGATWNPYRNEFGVSFSGETSSGGYSAIVIVPADNPSAFRRNTFNILGGGILTYITDIDFSTSAGRYVMSWYEAVKARIAEFDQDGNWLRGDIASVRVGVYDSLSLAYNPVSQTFLLVGLDPVTDRFHGLELSQNGVRLGVEVLLGPSSAYYARTGAATTSPRWMGTYARTFRATGVPIGTSTTGGGSGSVAPPPPPTTTAPPPAPAPTGCPGGSIPGMTCVNGEWVPTGSSGGSGGGSTGGCPGVVPGMTCVNGEWVPGGSSGGGGSTGGCPGVVPGMTCVNGEWVPGGSSGGGSTGGCPGFVPGMTCVNGEWVPGGSSGGGGSTGSCPGFVPGMTCVNGEWVPGGSSGGGGSTGSCPGFVPGMTCVNGEWVPGGGAACPGFVPGMICVNGEWTFVESFQRSLDWLASAERGRHPSERQTPSFVARL